MFIYKAPRQWLTIFCLVLVVFGCVPVPVSTVLLHPREKRPVAIETAQAEHFGTFSCPAFDSTGTLLAVYDSGTNLIRIFRISDLMLVNSLKPARRPRRLSFSPGNHFLVIEAYQGWIDAYLNSKLDKTSHVDISSPEAIRDDIQRVELWDLRSGLTIPNLSCDAVAITEPQSGWLWARKWAIARGYRSSALLEAHFSSDETEFLVLCWNGVQQRWNSRTWERLEDIPPPTFWDKLMGLSTAGWLAQNDPAGSSYSGGIVIFRVRQKQFGFPTIYLWDRNTFEIRQMPGECGSRLLPSYALSHDGNRLVAVCNMGLGHAIRVWDLGSGKEFSLKDTEFGFMGGLPSITRGGVALSHDGRHLAVALLGQMEALLPNLLLIPAGMERSDLRLWSVDEGRALVNIPIDDLVGSTGYFGGIDLAFSPDDSMLVVSGRRLRIYRLIDLASDAR
jgi:WD40 repeat protein